MNPRNWRAKGYVSLEQNIKEEKRFERILAFWSV
jgi:hypothetical protein